MKSLITVMCALSFLLCSPLAADRKNKDCDCGECQCTPESHCGCLSGKGCHCTEGHSCCGGKKCPAAKDPIPATPKKS